MGEYEALNYPEWGLIAAVTSGVAVWHLSVGDSFTSRVTSAVLAGGVTLAVGMRFLQWSHER